MRFIEETEAAWSAEQLAAAEREIEEQKREWEQNRLAAMREEEERRAKELEEENELLTFSREDATNQVSTNTKKVNKSETTHRKVGRPPKNRRLRLKNNVTKISINTEVMECSKQKHTLSDKVLVKALNKTEEENILTSPVSDHKFVENDFINCDKSNSSCKNDLDSDTNISQTSLHSNDNTVLSINGDTDGNETESDEELSYNSYDDSDKGLENHVDYNSPRTRSRGRVEINLWTLDVSPILPGVKPIKNNSLSQKKDKRIKNKDDQESDVEVAHKKNSESKKQDKENNKLDLKKCNILNEDYEKDIKRHGRKRNGSKTVDLETEKHSEMAADISIVNNSIEKKDISNTKKLVRETLEESTSLADLKRALARKLARNELITDISNLNANQYIKGNSDDEDKSVEKNVVHEIDSQKIGVTNLNNKSLDNISKENENATENVHDRNKCITDTTVQSGSDMINSAYKNDVTVTQCDCISNENYECTCNKLESKMEDLTSKIECSSTNTSPLLKERNSETNDHTNVSCNSSINSNLEENDIKIATDTNADKNLIQTIDLNISVSKQNENSPCTANTDSNIDVDKKVPKIKRLLRKSKCSAKSSTEGRGTLDNWIKKSPKTTRIDQLEDELTLTLSSNVSDEVKLNSVNVVENLKITHKRLRSSDAVNSSIEPKCNKLNKTE